VGAALVPLILVLTPLTGFGLLAIAVRRGVFDAPPNPGRLEEWHRLYDEQMLVTGDPRDAVVVADYGEPHGSGGWFDPVLPSEGGDGEVGRVVDDQHERLKLDYERLVDICNRAIEDREQLRRRLELLQQAGATPGGVRVAVPTEHVEVQTFGSAEPPWPVESRYEEVWLSSAELRAAAEAKLRGTPPQVSTLDSETIRV
jgi:hypothetical protein